MNVLDLFSGIGGFSLGLERAGMRTLAFCESDPHCVSVLREQWPHVPVFRDVRTLSVDPGFVDLICGGFPCQPFSTAARGRNNAVDLWPEFIRVVRSAQPTWVVAENVPGIGDAGIDRVSGDLKSAGYYVWPFDLDTTLPQRQRGRHRIIWLAHTNREGEPRFAEYEEMAGLSALSRFCSTYDAAPLGMDDGLPRRMDRLRQLGNSIDPGIAEAIGLTIKYVSNA
jgi:DNA (cytosine-5)-methyltransferase 1